MEDNVTELDQAHLDSIVSEAKSKLITSAYVQFANPFYENDREIIFEEFSVWREGFFQKLKAVLKAKRQEHYIVLQYVSPDSQTIRFIKGYRVSAAMTFEEYTTVAHDIGFAINGLEFHILDETMSWCIGTIVDVQFLTGDEVFMRAYYRSEDEKQEAIASFLDLVTPDDVYESFKQMKGYVRYRSKEAGVRRL